VINLENLYFVINKKDKIDAIELHPNYYPTVEITEKILPVKQKGKYKL